LEVTPSLNRKNLITNPIIKAGWYSVSFWCKLTTYVSSFFLNVNINDKTISNEYITSTNNLNKWVFISGNTYVDTLINSYGFIDFEGIPSGTVIVISDLTVVEGRSIPTIYIPPMTSIDASGIYTGTLTAT